MATGADLAALIDQLYPNDPNWSMTKQAAGGMLSVPESTLNAVRQMGGTVQPKFTDDVGMQKYMSEYLRQHPEILLPGQTPGGAPAPGPGPAPAPGTPGTPTPPAGPNPFQHIWDSMKPQGGVQNFGMMTTGIPMRSNGAPNSRRVWSDDEIRALGTTAPTPTPTPTPAAGNGMDSWVKFAAEDSAFWNDYFNAYPGDAGKTPSTLGTGLFYTNMLLDGDIDARQAYAEPYQAYQHAIARGETPARPTIPGQTGPWVWDGVPRGQGENSGYGIPAGSSNLQYVQFPSANSPDLQQNAPVRQTAQFQPYNGTGTPATGGSTPAPNAGNNAQMQELLTARQNAQTAGQAGYNNLQGGNYQGGMINSQYGNPWASDPTAQMNQMGWNNVAGNSSNPWATAGTQTTPAAGTPTGGALGPTSGSSAWGSPQSWGGAFGNQNGWGASS